MDSVFNFGTKYPPVLGIDISSSSIKILEMSGKTGHRVIEGYGYLPLPPNTMEGHNIKDIDAVSRTIQKVIDRNHLKSKFAVLSIPDALVINKVVQVNEGLNDSEIEELVIMEADKFIPFPIEEINIDFEVLGPSEKNTTMLDVMVVATRSEYVSTRVEAATNAGLQVKIMDVESFAIQRVCLGLKDEPIFKSKNNIIAIFDIGACFANLFVLQNSEVIFTREEEYGGNRLLESIEQHYNISKEEAIKLKNQKPLPDDYQEVILNPFIETMLVHVKRALQFFYSVSNDRTVDQIILTGGLAKIPNLSSMLAEKITIPTMVLNPFTNFSLGSKLKAQRLAEDAPLLMIACGLALRQLGKKP